MRHWLKSDSTAASALPKAERHRLGLSLHHSTAQSLAALTINLDLIEQRATHLDPRARRLLEESRSLASACFEEVLGLVAALDPTLVDEIARPREGPAPRQEAIKPGKRLDGDVRAR